jgi:hypothetical protein
VLVIQHFRLSFAHHPLEETFMSDASAFGFGKFVPGFDFLQNLSKTAAQATPAAGAGAVPGMASWVAPTLSVEEIDKRIQELKSVLFWLEQNTTALKATIQAMEVQKMTLSTLQSMNVSMADLAKAFTAKPPAAAEPAAPQAAPSPAPEPVKEEPAPEEVKETAAESSAKPAVDPMQWWGALTQQFQDIAAAAVKDVAAEAMKAGMTAKGASTTASAKKAPAVKKAPAKKTASASKKPAAKAPVRKAATRKSS